MTTLSLYLSVMTTAFVGVFGWVWNTQGRVTVLETKAEGLRELIEAEFSEVRGRLSRIEAALDRR